MYRWPILMTLVLLSGCANTVELSSSDTPMVSGTLKLEWIEPHAIEIQLDGVRYVGAWINQVCTTDACRGKFRNVLKIHRRHILHGQTTLMAKTGARLDFDWVSHLPEVDGTCHTQDGRLFKLTSGKSTVAATTP